MFAASPTVLPSSLPRPTPHPLRRVVGSLLVAATVLALLATSAVPTRADGRSEQLAPALVTAVTARAVPMGRAASNLATGRPVEVRSPRMPAVCAVEISGARRNVTVYPERCLRRTGFDYRLPRQCAYEARISGRIDRVYAAPCLRDFGFSVGRGHDRGLRDHGRGHGRDFGQRHPRRYH